MAHWCSACKVLSPEFERAAALVRQHGLSVVLARVDAAAHAEWAKEEIGVERLPTFSLYREHGARAEEFPSLTTGEAVVAGLAKMLGSALELTPAKEFGADAGALEVAEWLFWRGTGDGKLLTTVVFYEPRGLAGAAAAASAAAFAAFDAAARGLLQFSNLRFAVAREAAVLEAFELPADRHTLVLYKDHDEGRAEYGGAADAAALRAWILREDTPLVTDVWHRTLQGMRRRVRTFALFFVEESQLEHFPTLTRVKAGLRAAVAALEARGLVRRGELTIAVANGQKYKSWRAELGLPADGALPALGIEHVARRAMYAAPDFALAAGEGIPANATLRRSYRLSALHEALATPSPAAEVALGADGAPAPTEHPAADMRVPWVQVPVDAVVDAFAHFFGEHPDLLADPALADVLAGGK